MKKYEDLFTNVEDIRQNFVIEEKELTDKMVLAAVYYDESYSGSAFILFEKNGKVYTVNGSHCSCYGLEGQWEPEETSWETVLHWLDKGEMFRSFESELRTHLHRVASRRMKKNANK